MAKARRENDSRRVAQTIQDHSNTMEALRRATSKPYDPNATSDFTKAHTFVSGADVISKGDNGKYFRNNVRVRDKYERNK